MPNIARKTEKSVVTALLFSVLLAGATPTFALPTVITVGDGKMYSTIAAA